MTLHVVENGDHSLSPSRQKDKVAATYVEIQDEMVKWIRKWSRPNAWTTPET